jgi:transcriptional regulator with XRE-family HTH domain
LDIGPRLKNYRLQRGYSLQDLSERSGVSPSMLSKIERGEKNPTIQLLCNIVEALEITLSQLIDEPVQPEVILTKGENRLILKDESYGFERHLLSPTFPSKGIEFVMFLLPKGTRTGTFPPHQKEVREYIYVDTGHLQVVLGGSKRYDLDPGDTLYYEANTEHECINVGQGVCRYFLVIDSNRLN